LLLDEAAGRRGVVESRGRPVKATAPLAEALRAVSIQPSEVDGGPQEKLDTGSAVCARGCAKTTGSRVAPTRGLLDLQARPRGRAVRRPGGGYY